jgi:hypothetical protein
MPMHDFFEAPARPRHIAFLMSSVAAFLILSVPLEAEIRNQATVGYDSFIDRFTLLEADTFESVQDLYFGLGNALYYRDGGSKAGFSNYFRFGNQTVDEHLDVEGSIVPVGSTAIDLRSALNWKHFREGSDYEFGNDYTQGNALLRIRTNAGRHSRLSLKSRFEIVDYREKTDFDYDYRYFDGGAEWETGEGMDGMLHLGILAGKREVPDTTALSYDRLFAEIETRFSPAAAVSFQLLSAADRKEYRLATRSSYWNVTTQVELSRGSAGSAVFSLRGESEILHFDRSDATYFDTHFLRAGFRARFPVWEQSAMYVEPRYAILMCGSFPEERYREVSFVLAAEVMRSNGFWLSLSYEPGFRGYELDENELYSDFYLNRLSAVGSLPLPVGTTLNVLVTHEPERHSRREDDFSMTLVSIDITKRF